MLPYNVYLRIEISRYTHRLQLIGTVNAWDLQHAEVLATKRFGYWDEII
jgi:hypothetical protein